MISEAIESVVRWLEARQVTVHMYCPQLPCCGMYRSETREIFLNTPNAKEALITLLHEAGHWYGYQVREKPHSYQRERQAFVYGWSLANTLGCTNIISRQDWLDYERERRESPDIE